MKRSALAGAILAGVLPGVTAAQEGVTEPVGEVTNALSEITLVQAAAAEFVLVALVGIALLALHDGWGGHALGHARGGLVFSLLVGIPATLSLLGLVFVGAVMMATIFGSVIGIPILGVVGSLLLVWHSIGFVALGTWTTGLLGIANPYPGVFLGAGVAAVFVAAVFLSPLAGSMPLLIVSSLGVGAGVRASYGRYTVDASERQIPPKHQHIKR